MKTKSIALLFLFAGIISFLIAFYGFYTIYDTTRKYEHTEGVVKELTVRRVYEHRKMRRVQEAVITYDTNRGNYELSMRLSNPLIFQDTKLNIWYDSESPEKIMILFEEVVTWLLPLGIGLFGLFVGILGLRKDNEESI